MVTKLTTNLCLEELVWKYYSDSGLPELGRIWMFSPYNKETDLLVDLSFETEPLDKLGQVDGMYRARTCWASILAFEIIFNMYGN